MDQVSYADGYKAPKWYSQPQFPIVPVLNIRKPVAPRNEWDSGTPKGFSFSWLFVKVWSLEHPSIELAACIDTHWGIGILGQIPYLRWVVSIPCPPSIADWVTKHLNRKP